MSKPKIIKLKKRNLKDQVEYWKKQWLELFAENVMLKKKRKSRRVKVEIKLYMNGKGDWDWEIWCCGLVVDKPNGMWSYPTTALRAAKRVANRLWPGCEIKEDGNDKND